MSFAILFIFINVYYMFKSLVFRNRFKCAPSLLGMSIIDTEDDSLLISFKPYSVGYIYNTFGTVYKPIIHMLLWFWKWFPVEYQHDPLMTFQTTSWVLIRDLHDSTSVVVETDQFIYTEYQYWCGTQYWCLDIKSRKLDGFTVSYVTHDMSYDNTYDKFFQMLPASYQNCYKPLRWLLDLNKL